MWGAGHFACTNFRKPTIPHPPASHLCHDATDCAPTLSLGTSLEQIAAESLTLAISEFVLSICGDGPGRALLHRVPRCAVSTFRVVRLLISGRTTRCGGSQPRRRPDRASSTVTLRRSPSACLCPATGDRHGSRKPQSRIAWPEALLARSEWARTCETPRARACRRSARRQFPYRAVPLDIGSHTGPADDRRSADKSRCRPPWDPGSRSVFAPLPCA